MNKSYILALGVLGSPLLTTNSNAQTFYQCMPLSCKDGQYVKDGKCTSCPAGYYQKGNDRATSCSPCPAGKFSGTGASSCTDCSAGTYSNGAASSCTTCEAGNYCTGGKKYACSAGQYSAAGASSCTTCPAGEYQNLTGQSSCKKCSAQIILMCTYKYCNSAGGSSENGGNGHVTVYGGPISMTNQKLDCPTGATGSIGLTCFDGKFQNNDSGYFTVLSKRFAYGTKSGGCATLTCNRETGTLISLDVHD